VYHTFCLIVLLSDGGDDELDDDFDKIDVTSVSTHVPL
jgi:hypothetical protein